MTDEIDLSKLTEEERRVLEEDATLTESVDEETVEIDEEGEDGDEDADPKPEDGDEKPKPQDEEPDPAELRNDPAPILPIDAPSDIDDKLKALADEKAAVVQRFDDGELTAREYSDALEAIADKRQDIMWEKKKAEMGREAHERAIADAWDRDVANFMATTAAKVAEKGEPALLALDAYVKRVTGDPANARLSNAAQLEKAFKLFSADFGPAFGVESTPKTAPKPPAPAAKSRVIPPTLARVPAADHESTEDGRFAVLDRLAETDPIAYQKRLARMTPQEREEYGL